MIRLAAMAELAFWRNPCPAIARIHEGAEIVLVAAGDQATTKDFCMLSVSTLSQLLLLAGFDVGDMKTLALPSGKSAVPG